MAGLRLLGGRVASSLLFSLATLSIARANIFSLTDRYTADPAPFVHEGRLYIYTSHDFATQSGWLMTDYSLMSTDDLQNWRDEGIVFDINNQTWGVYAWAQQVSSQDGRGLPSTHEALGGPLLRKQPRRRPKDSWVNHRRKLSSPPSPPQVIDGTDGKFYMFYPAMHTRPGDTRSGTGVAVSDSVTGPFNDALGHPLLPCGDDPTVFRDDDGTQYVCGNCDGGAKCAQLAPNMTSLLGPYTLVKLPQWFEAPWLSKWKGVYYLSYMCSGDPGHGQGDFNHLG